MDNWRDSAERAVAKGEEGRCCDSKVQIIVWVSVGGAISACAHSSRAALEKERLGR